ncbi:MAG: hypothetical protein SH848_14205 [Saprospiraceae bacterium]|nr:hypothetical protein [Saprospiraceae bacterium]
MKGLYDLDQKFSIVKSDDCLISEITLAELKFRVENSQHREKNQQALDNFLTNIQIVPIFQAIDIYAKEKARLRKVGHRLIQLRYPFRGALPKMRWQSHHQCQRSAGL